MVAEVADSILDHSLVATRQQGGEAERQLSAN